MDSLSSKIGAGPFCGNPSGREDEIEIVALKIGMEIKIVHLDKKRHMIVAVVDGFLESTFESCLGSKAESLASLL